jgi:pyruvate,water dikinase
MTAWILGPAEAADSPYVGGKARALARAERAGLPVPRWFVVSAAAFSDSLTPDQRAEIDDALDRAVRDLSPNGELLAVRSSASDEDGHGHSFAGQFDSHLNVAPDDVAQRVRAVRQSAFSDRVLAYRREHGLPLAARPPAVVIQRMVQPRAAGVAFSADPVSGRRSVAVVSAVNGLGSALVSGEADADTWLVDREGAICERRVAAEHAALSDEDVRAVARLARVAAGHFGAPQDIEWALADRLVLLQSRPIAPLRLVADPDSPPVIWDNSNIVESYSGVTTPMTFSFAREIYQHVYQQFCRMMGVPGRAIEQHDERFRNMLGLIRGRMYYNLLNWHRVLALLPGYSVNRRFMEQMMGVKETLPAALAAEVANGARRGRALDAVYLARTIAGLLVNHLTLSRRVDAFYKRLDEALAPPAPPLEARTADELVASYRDLRRRLLLKWDAPLVTDFFAMVFYGLLRHLVTRWCGDSQGTLQNDLIGGQGGMVSAEPAVRLQRLAHLAAADTALLNRLATADVETILASLEPASEFMREYSAYLAKFGDRTFNELKLESTTFDDDPLPLLRAIGALARQVDGSRRADPTSSSGERLRTEARRRVDAALAGHPLRRLLFPWVLRNARRRVRDRENLRLERTRLFGRVRRIVIELGRRLHSAGRLDDPRDVFYLEIDEVLALVEGRSTCTDVRSLAALRKREFVEYERGPAPDDRFETRGTVYHGHDFRRLRARRPEAGEERRGLGCCPGVVRGQVRFVADPRTADLSGRMILVAEHTDPGWIVVFPSATGVLVERGSLLSHAAIVARELGIPTVVSVPGLTRWLRDGDWVEMDGGAGTIRRLETTYA